MLKYILLAAVMVVLTMAITEKEAKDGLQMFAGSCDKEPTEADYTALIHNDPNPPLSAKCFQYCILRQINLITENNTIDVNMAKQFTTMVYKGEEELGGEIAQACNEKHETLELTELKDTEQCELAFNYTTCVQNELKAHGKEIEKVTN